MKRIVKLVMLLLLISLLFTSVSFAKSDQAKKSLVALGDSIPYGYNLGDSNLEPSKLAYPYVIGESINSRVRNISVPGATTEDLLASLQHQKYRQAIRHADVVTLTIGNNDLLRALGYANAVSGGDPLVFQQVLQQEIAASNVFGNLQQIIKEITNLTDATIVVYNVYNPFQVTDPLHYVGLSVLPNINNQIAQIVSGTNQMYKNQIVLADAYSAFGQNQAEYVIVGDIHPTVAGQKKLADIGVVALRR
ncbi:GDSL-type esterase/lipase family protein [Bacillus alkalicellulosilyticus]|uniref:GDSL-type esterase/lipase family protein n=1 Tax=Alkalihalobacterium alkalicellulosilyticum TaxID=1912214 RepID=UPI000997DF46|nr:GDSL-type esterase/lipase family protein [Bacillus alkalicellulosilyticus]